MYMYTALIVRTRKFADKVDFLLTLLISEGKLNMWLKSRKNCQYKHGEMDSAEEIGGQVSDLSLFFI